MRITQLLGIDFPIIQAPMVGVSTPQLAAAVSNAGALGSIGIGASSPAQAEAMISETRKLTDRAFNVNLFCHRPARLDPVREQQWLEHLRPLFAEFDAEPPAGLREIYRSFVDDPKTLEVLLDTRPDVVSFHFGLPKQDWINSLKARGIRLVATATSLDEARQIASAGLDAIVAQGAEAGGHRGVFDPSQDTLIGTFALVRSLAQQSKLPIIAAGGIMDGMGIRAAMQLGAAGAQLGTAFILCPESAANPAYRAAMKSPRVESTAISSAISGRPARGLVNRLFTDVGSSGAPELPDYPIAYDAAKALHAVALAKGCEDFAVQWAGQGAPLAREMPAADLITTLAKEMAAQD
ncbi:nitronate monooxygenase [Pseudomonas sp. R-28-1W-6]|uniref:NAD(P)H-dependent flavin oxidoreductase n=1 Tax=Pseudomonas sp. R-28-1W-6 TaxID=2650101 RepID=UPI0013665AF5|nr:nitronate monooxygenase [Pseudomonas sp. R-28-1W-6]MWV14305.1 nitronate monooxygenase [Pseudomonas sp. R-28-1W-6]